MNDFQQLKRGFISLMGGTLISSMLGFISIALVARGLGLNEFGVFAIITSYALMIDKLFNFQSWQALIKFGADFLESKNIDDNKKIISLCGFCFSIDIVSAVLSFIIAIICSNFIIEYFSWNNEAKISIYVISLSCLFKFSSFGIGVFRLFKKDLLQAKVLSYSALIKSLLVFVAYIFDAGMVAYASIWVFSEFILNLFYVYYSIKIVKNDYNNETVKLGLNKTNNDIVRFVLWTNLSGAVDLPAKELDVIMVGLLANDSQAGLYKLAKQAMVMIGRLAGPLYQAAYPIQAKFVARNEIFEVLKFTSKVSFKSVYFSFAVIAISFFTMETIVNTFLDTSYKDLIPLAIFAVILKAIDTNFTLFHSLFIAMGFVKYNVSIVLISNVIMMFIFLILIPIYGALGALIALFFQSIMTFTWKLLYIKRNSHV